MVKLPLLVTDIEPKILNLLRVIEANIFNFINRY